MTFNVKKYGTETDGFEQKVHTQKTRLLRSSLIRVYLLAIPAKSPN